MQQNKVIEQNDMIVIEHSDLQRRMFNRFGYKISMKKDDLGGRMSLQSQRNSSIIVHENSVEKTLELFNTLVLEKLK